MIAGLAFTAITIGMIRSVQIFGTAEPMLKDFFGISALGVGFIGMLVNMAVMVIVSLMTPPPPHEVQELVESLRYPRAMASRARGASGDDIALEGTATGCAARYPQRWGAGGEISPRPALFRSPWRRPTGASLRFPVPCPLFPQKEKNTLAAIWLPLRVASLKVLATLRVVHLVSACSHSRATP
jgi:hypothetical protein